MAAPAVPTLPPTGFMAIARQLGPGLIISATIVGSGELIVTPKLGATYGVDLLWFIVIGCLIKVFVQIELGRYAVLHGGTSLEAMNRIPGPRLVVSWLVWLWLLMFAATFFQVAGMVGGLASIAELSGLPANRSVVAIAIGVVTAVLLAIGRYRFIERASALMVAAFTIGTLIAVGALQTTPYAITGDDLARGLSFHLPPTFTVAFAAFGIIGVGASELIYYPYWCLEKGYAKNVGSADNSPGWLAQARGWLRILRIDSWFACAIYTLSTLAFYLLGASVLHDKGLAVENADMIATLSHMYQETFGAWSLPVFLVGAFAVLYSTVFGATASNTRLVADSLVLFGLARPTTTEVERQRRLRVISLILPISWVAIYLIWGQPVTLVVIGAVAQGLMLPFLGVLAVWLHHRHPVAAVQSGRPWRVALWLSALSMATAGGYQVWMAARGPFAQLWRWLLG
jgi:manganese transport protein